MLYADTYCKANGCTFRLTDPNMENLAAAMPRLEHLDLGFPCHSNSCNTTVVSLLSISTNCLDLRFLEIHFNASTIAADMRRLLDGGPGHDKAKCQLRMLCVGYLPIEVGEEDDEPVGVVDDTDGESTKVWKPKRTLRKCVLIYFSRC